MLSAWVRVGHSERALSFGGYFNVGIRLFYAVTLIPDRGNSDSRILKIMEHLRRMIPSLAQYGWMTCVYYYERVSLDLRVLLPFACTYLSHDSTWTTKLPFTTFVSTFAPSA